MSEPRLQGAAKRRDIGEPVTQGVEALSSLARAGRGTVTRIIIHPGSYSFRNAGDVAMFQVAATRLRKSLPLARMTVLTTAPEMLAEYQPDANPLDPALPAALFRGLSFWPRLEGRIPGSALGRLAGAEVRLRLRFPRATRVLLRAGMKMRTRANLDIGPFVEMFHRADALVVSGCGGVNDSFKGTALFILNLLDMAIRNGIPTAMFGQGIGPIRDPMLRQRARQVLPKLEVLALRESRAGLPLVQELGVSPSRVVVTGDDAVEMSYARRLPRLGRSLGVNLRVAPYAGVERTHFGQLRNAILSSVGQLGAPIVPIPISSQPGESDEESIRDVLGDLQPREEATSLLMAPSSVIDLVSLCRVVVTGSYHGAAFAMAQGIPVVALSSSAYYADKFHGIADVFGSGCGVVDLDPRETLERRVFEAILLAWETAEDGRARLLEAACRQVSLGVAAYERFARVLTARRDRQQFVS